MHSNGYPIRVNENFKLLVANIKYLMKPILENVSPKYIEKVTSVFKRKLKFIIKKILIWYTVYKKSIPDGLLMLNEQNDNVLKKYKFIHDIYSKLNYKINEELYNCMQRIYNL